METNTPMATIHTEYMSVPHFLFDPQNWDLVRTITSEYESETSEINEISKLLSPSLEHDIYSTLKILRSTVDSLDNIKQVDFDNMSINDTRACHQILSQISKQEHTQGSLDNVLNYGEITYSVEICQLSKTGNNIPNQTHPTINSYLTFDMLILEIQPSNRWTVGALVCLLDFIYLLDSAILTSSPDFERGFDNPNSINKVYGFYRKAAQVLTKLDLRQRTLKPR